MTPTTDTDQPITLADLSDEDRIALLAQAREEAKRNPVDVDGYAELPDRDKRVRALMDARDHARDCPVALGLELGRVEGYDARKPPRPDLGEPARDVGVIRCIECGGASVLDESIDVAVRGAELPERTVEPAKPAPRRNGRKKAGAGGTDTDLEL